jgi:hypothetical protein
MDFRNILETKKSTWSLTGSMIPKGMKEFFQARLYLDLILLFIHDQMQMALPWPEAPSYFILQTQEMLHMLFDAIKTFYNFAYKEQLHVCWTARTCIISVYHYHKWQLTVTQHFMLNEAFIFAKKDGGAYLTLQEGVERAHLSDKRDVIHTFNGSASNASGYTNWEQLLDKQQLKRYFKEKGYAPKGKLPLPYEGNHPDHLNISLYLPIHAPALTKYPVLP